VISTLNPGDEILSIKGDQQLWQIVGGVEKSLLAVSGFVVLVGLTGMMVAIMTSLNERRREMAILRAVGARPSHILALIVGEASIITAAGVILGTVIFYGLVIVIRSIIGTYLGLFMTIGAPSLNEGSGAAVNVFGRGIDRPCTGISNLPFFAGRRHGGKALRKLIWVKRSLCGDTDMKNRLLKLLVLMVFSLSLLAPVFASTVRELNWDDLIPNSVTFDDPFEALDRETLEYLGFVARVRNMVAAGKETSQETMEELAEIEASLTRDGIDIDDLLARRDEIRELRKKRAGAVATNLDGASVKMPGYVLPLEYSEHKVTEFLLVPWVGACIHTPPPPPNQIVHVVLDTGNAFESRSMYEPVWVVGEMVTQNTSRNLFLKDGSSDISIGYKLQATLVEKFKK